MRWLKKEFFHLLPAFFFFLIAFNLINLTEGLMLKKEGVGRFSFITLLIASGIVAKVLVIIDNLPWISLFPPRPLIYNVLWKTCLYGSGVCLVRFLDRLIPFLLSAKDMSEGYHNFILDINWMQFWAVQSWFFMLFFLFVAFRELVNVIGADRMRRIFFSRFK